MADSLNHVVTQKTKQTLRAAKFLSLTIDEVTNIDNQSWLSVHGYVMEKWERKPILLSLQWIVDGCNADNLTNVILTAAMWHGGLTETEVAERLICFGTDGAAIFQGCQTGVTTQLHYQQAPYMIGMHCVAHRTSLVVGTLSNLPMVAKLENLCKSLYSYFGSSPKHHLEFSKLAEVVESEGLKILRNVKSRWMSILAPLERIMGEYKNLIVKMSLDAPSTIATRSNLVLLIDLQTLFGLPCILPLLTKINQLIKFSQARDIFICDFVGAVQLYEA